MINIVKIESINATENCLLNNCSVRIFLPTELFLISSGIRQKGESQNGRFKKAKHTKYSEKQTFLTP